MQRVTEKGEINTATVVLALLLAVAVGLLAGLYLSRSNPGIDPAGRAQAGGALPEQQERAVVPVLSAEEAATIEGFTCNCREPGCNFLPVATCACPTAQAMRTMVKRLFAENKTRDEIARELESIWGDGIYPGSAPGPPSPAPPAQ